MTSPVGWAIEEFAAAKINLALHVTGRRQDGLHLLDSLVAFAKVGDILRFADAEESSLDINGRFSAGLSSQSDNLVLRAAQSWRKHLGIKDKHAAITLNKNLPVASGIGGGSADAAATIRGLSRLWDIYLDIEQADLVAAELGADIAVCLRSSGCVMSGTGEVIDAIADLPTFPVVLANPGVPVSTTDVFSALDLTKGCKAFSAMDTLPERSSLADWTAWLRRQRNDLQEAAVRLVPEIAECLVAIGGTEGCQLARMSGSGATCFALFETEAQAKAAAAEISAAQPEWWVTDTLVG